MKIAFGALAFLLMLLTAAAAPARTITVTAVACDEMAVLCSQAPRLSWGITQGAHPLYHTQPNLHWNSTLGLLMRFPIQELVPAGQRIAKAELTIAPHYLGGQPVIQVRRMLAEWGIGVCHQYRMTFPKKLEWAQPGARGAAVDRAARDSAVFKLTKPGESTVDVTEDVELWYTGAVANRGWIMTVENEGHVAYINSPYGPGSAGDGVWKLQITFEPK